MDPLILLRERIDILEEEFRQIKAHFMVTRYPTWRGLKLSPMETVVLSALSDGKVWPTERLCQRLNLLMLLNHDRDTNHLRVVIHRVKKKLGACIPPITITTFARVGYQLDPISAANLTSRFNPSS